MAVIDDITVEVHTDGRFGAGTDGYVYVGILGREFALDKTGDDFERGSTDVFILGNKSNVFNSLFNDPQAFPILDSADVDKYPVYIRFEPDGVGPDWTVNDVLVHVNVGSTKITYRNNTLKSRFQRIVLSQDSGKFLYLSKA